MTTVTHFPLRVLSTVSRPQTSSFSDRTGNNRPSRIREVKSAEKIVAKAGGISNNFPLPVTGESMASVARTIIERYQSPLWYVVLVSRPASEVQPLPSDDVQYGRPTSVCACDVCSSVGM